LLENINNVNASVYKYKKYSTIIKIIIFFLIIQDYICVNFNLKKKFKYYYILIQKTIKKLNEMVLILNNNKQFFKL